MNEKTRSTCAALIEVLRELDGDELIDSINEVRTAMHEAGPFANEPVDCVLWVKQSDVQANDYNPNAVAPPEMKLLEHSIHEDGFTQPIVAYDTGSGHEVIDGFHRNQVGRQSEEIKTRIHDRLPVAVVNQDRTARKDRMASTVRHNRARGTHGIKPMAGLVSEMYLNGWSNARICRELGMEKDEVLRLKQFCGLGTLFENRDFSPAWDIKIDD